MSRMSKFEESHVTSPKFFTTHPTSTERAKVACHTFTSSRLLKSALRTGPREIATRSIRDSKSKFFLRGPKGQPFLIPARPKNQ